MTNARINELARFYRRSLLDDCVKFWFPRSVDTGHGGFFSALDRDGSLLDTDKSVWAQGRMTWLLATVNNTVERRSECGRKVSSIIAVQKPYMERRAFASIRKQWPEVAVRLSSPPLGFENYGNADIPIEEVIHIMVGDMQRIWEYPRLGFMIPQEVPDEVSHAYELLIRAGYTRHLIAFQQ